jgi:hypothetical protein
VVLDYFDVILFYSPAENQENCKQAQVRVADNPVGFEHGQYEIQINRASTLRHPVLQDRP